MHPLSAAEYNKQLPIPGSYARSWKRLKDIAGRFPDKDVSVPGWIVGMRGWGAQTESARSVLRRVRQAANSRINARAGFVPMEAREGDTALIRDHQRVMDIAKHRARIYQFESPRVYRRLAHLLSSYDD